MIRQLIIYLSIGLFAGWIYFYALWLSLTYLNKIKNKKAYLALTTLVRLVLLLVCLYFVITRIHGAVFLVIVGFVIARTLFIKMKGDYLFKNTPLIEGKKETDFD